MTTVLGTFVRDSLLEYLNHFERNGSEPAYVTRRSYRAERWTYGQVAHCAYQVAHELQLRGIEKGDRLMLWGENCAEWVVAFLGCALRGVVVIPMDNSAVAGFALRVYQQVQARMLVCSREHAPDAAGLPTIVLPDLPHLVSLHNSSESKLAALDRNHPLQIVFTSGTTAEPKGVVITHGNVLANLEPLENEIQKYLKYEWLVHPVRFLNLLPLSHVFGQFLGIFLPQLLAGTVIFQDALSPSEIIRTIRRERVSVLVAVPRMLQSLKNKLERELDERGALPEFRRSFQQAEGKHFLGRWWTFRQVHREFGWKFWALVCGGAALDPVTEEFWGRLGYAVIQGYGLTETTSLISLNHPFKLGKGSVGKVLSGREVKLDRDGEILVRGGGVSPGYWNGRGLAPAVGEEGWYRTGDIGELDAEGNLYFKGRKKDVIVTPAGMNVYPEDLEAALRHQPEVRDCVVIALNHGGNAEPCAVLILRDHAADAGAVIQRANQSLAEYQRMREWSIWPEEDFPRTPTLKPKVREVQARIEAQSAPGANSASDSALAQMISRITGRAASNLRPNWNLESDLNLSSLERVELMSALEDRYQLDLSETSFADARTVADLEKMLRGGTAPRVHYHYPGWALRWPVTWIRLFAHYLLLRPAVLLLGWPRIRGRENLNGFDGPVLVVCNHIDDVDVGFVLTALPPRIRHRLAAAAGGESMEALHTPPPRRSLGGKIIDRIKWLMGAALLNIFPLPRQAGFRESFQYAAEAVDRGYSVLVFPEGQHTKTGEILPFRAGVGILANQLRLPVVPLRIDGLFEVKKAGKRMAPPGKISVSIGPPIKFEPGRDPAQIARELQKSVEQLG